MASCGSSSQVVSTTSVEYRPPTEDVKMLVQYRTHFLTEPRYSRPPPQAGWDRFEAECFGAKGIRIQDGEEVYHVKWKGYPVDEMTWEPTENFPPLCLEQLLGRTRVTISHAEHEAHVPAKIEDEMAAIQDSLQKGTRAKEEEVDIGGGGERTSRQLDSDAEHCSLNDGNMSLSTSEYHPTSDDKSEDEAEEPARHRSGPFWRGAHMSPTRHPEIRPPLKPRSGSPDAVTWLKQEETELAPPMPDSTTEHCSFVNNQYESKFRRQCSSTDGSHNASSVVSRPTGRKWRGQTANSIEVKVEPNEQRISSSASNVIANPDRADDGDHRLTPFPSGQHLRPGNHDTSGSSVIVGDLRPPLRGLRHGRLMPSGPPQAVNHAGQGPSKDVPRQRKPVASAQNPDQKCHRCFRYQGHCDGKRPCGTCRKYRRPCEDAETPSVVRRRGEQDPNVRCQSCRKDRRNCDEGRPRCGRCTMKTQICCYGVDDGVDQGLLQATESFHGAENVDPVPRVSSESERRFVNLNHYPLTRKARAPTGQNIEEKCYSCARRRCRCDQQQPICGRCAQDRSRCSWGRPPPKRGQDPEDKCDPCRKDKLRCGEGTPCDTCQRRRRSCLRTGVIPAERREDAVGSEDTGVKAEVVDEQKV